MKRESRAGAAAAVAGVSVAACYLLPVVASWSARLCAFAPESGAPILQLAVVGHILPGLVVGLLLGLAVALLSPVRRVAVLILPAILVFLACQLLQLALFPIAWSTRFVVQFLLPEWAAFFAGAAATAAIGKKLKVSSSAAARGRTTERATKE